ncbi:MAG: hypothetical protein LBK13_03040 [Spirochaetales bacterium]|jgi:hypothetical protein|nr:hypothetical protein [Spirochaetales bacterium]
MAYLTKEIADALCAVIALGFSAPKIDRRRPMIYEYDELEDKEGYEKVRDFFNRYKVQVIVQMSPCQTLMPYVLGTDLPLEQKQKFIDNLINKSDRVRMMMKKAAEKGNPKGAYIGIAFTVGTDSETPAQEIDPSVFGPSELCLYDPVYRQVTDCCVKKAYDEAKNNTNAAAAAVVEGNGNKSDKMSKYDKAYESGKLFRSCHGMIRAMATQPAPAAGGTTVYAELALGGGTKKVSSCLPCAMFMESFGKPASSIHLGRGDNWGLPCDVPADVKTAWKKSIVDNYEKGISLFNPVVPFIDGTPSFDNYIKNQICKPLDKFIDELPAVFLEALTFESPFSAKIINTSTGRLSNTTGT